MTRDVLPLGSDTGEVLFVCVCVFPCFLLLYKVTCGQMDSYGPSNYRIEREVLETHSEVFNVLLRKHTTVVELLTCSEGINIKFIICRCPLFVVCSIQYGSVIFALYVLMTNNNVI
jgi:hypothetical protein